MAERSIGRGGQSVRELIERLQRAAGNNSHSFSRSSGSDDHDADLDDFERPRSPRRPLTRRSTHVNEELASRFPATYTRPRRPLSIRSQQSRSIPQKTGKVFTRNIFLIPDPKTTSVPRGVSRQRLYEKGLVMNFIEFHTSWDEKKMTNVIEKAFESVLSGEAASPR